MLLEPVIETVEVFSSRGDKSGQFFQLCHTNRRLHVSQFQVVANLRVNVLMVVTIRKPTKLPIKPATASVIMTSRTPTISTPVTQRLNYLAHACSFCLHTSTFSHRHMMCGVKTRRRQIPKRANWLAVVHRTNCIT